MSADPPPKFNLSSQCHNLDRASLQTTYLWTKEYSGGKVMASNAVFLDEQTPQEPTMFERLLHMIAHKAGKSGNRMDEVTSRQWQEDERNVRDGTCTFQVQYLGSMAVHSTKGVQLCEDVIRALKRESQGEALKRNDHKLTGPDHCGWATMRITGQAITVIDEDSQNVIVDDTIRSITFCAADRRHEKCFAYIARVSPAERRWNCHAFTALTATGARLNHAVGCAFSTCQENGNSREQADLQSRAKHPRSDQLDEEATAADTFTKSPDPFSAAPRSSLGSKPEMTSRHQVSIEMENVELK